MMLPIRKNFFTPAQFALASAGVLGTTQKFAIDRTWPIEEIIIYVDVTAGATGPTLSGVDNVLGIVKRVNLSINDGVQPRSVVDVSGPGLLERASLIGLNLDSATLTTVGLSRQTAIANNQKFRIAYRIPLVHPCFSEKLRSRCLLPVHLYPQDPVLTVDFEASANMCSAGSFASVVASVQLIRRVMPQSVSDLIIKTGGYIPSDIMETPFTVAAGIAGELRFPIPTPGSYTDLVFRQYLGGASVTRDVLDQTTNFGSETRWRLESGGVVYSDWRWKQLQTINDLSRTRGGVPQDVFVAASSAGAVTTALHKDPSFALVAAGTSYEPAASTVLDFLTDGVGSGDSANELGSLLDTNLPTQSGLRMELIGSVASVATNGSTLYVVGQRLYGDLKRWQAVE